MKLNRIWVVTDASPVSELDDVLFETTIEKLAAYVVGTGIGLWKKEHTTIYTEEGEARKDALARLAQDKKTKSPYSLSPADRANSLYVYDRSGSVTG